MRPEFVKRPITFKMNLIPSQFLGKETRLVCLRELHTKLKVETRFNDWIDRRIQEYGFVEGKDFIVFRNMPKNSKGGRPSIEYFSTISMAEKLTLIESRRIKHKEKEQLYVILFDTGLIKVGKGVNAMKRITLHAQNAAIFDRKMLKFFIENDPKMTEKELIDYCLLYGTLHGGNEYFKDLDYDTVIQFLVEKPLIKSNKTFSLKSNIVPILPYREQQSETRSSVY